MIESTWEESGDNGWDLIGWQRARWHRIKSQNKAIGALWGDTFPFSALSPSWLNCMQTSSHLICQSLNNNLRVRKICFRFKIVYWSEVEFSRSFIFKKYLHKKWRGVPWNRCEIIMSRKVNKVVMELSDVRLGNEPVWCRSAQFLLRQSLLGYRTC